MYVQELPVCKTESLNVRQPLLSLVMQEPSLYTAMYLGRNYCLGYLGVVMLGLLSLTSALYLEKDCSGTSRCDKISTKPCVVRIRVSFPFPQSIGQVTPPFKYNITMESDLVFAAVPKHVFPLPPFSPFRNVCNIRLAGRDESVSECFYGFRLRDLIVLLHLRISRRNNFVCATLVILLYFCSHCDRAGDPRRSFDDDSPLFEQWFVIKHYPRVTHLIIGRTILFKYRTRIKNLRIREVALRRMLLSRLSIYDADRNNNTKYQALFHYGTGDFADDNLVQGTFLLMAQLYGIYKSSSQTKLSQSYTATISYLVAYAPRIEAEIQAGILNHLASIYSRHAENEHRARHFGLAAPAAEHMAFQGYSVADEPFTYQSESFFNNFFKVGAVLIVSLGLFRQGIGSESVGGFQGLLEKISALMEKDPVSYVPGLGSVHMGFHLVGLMKQVVNTIVEAYRNGDPLMLFMRSRDIYAVTAQLSVLEARFEEYGHDSKLLNPAVVYGHLLSDANKLLLQTQKLDALLGTSQSKATLAKVKTFINELDNFVRNSIIASATRDKPFTIIFRAPPSVGKSRLVEMVRRQFANDNPMDYSWSSDRLVKNDRKLDPTAVYSRMVNATTDQYWNNFKPWMWAIDYDDIGVIRPNIESTSTTTVLSEFIKVVNETPFIVSMASIGEKGTYATPQLVTGTTNTDDLHANYAAATPAAILRRIDCFVDVVVKQQFRKGDSTQLDSEKVLAHYGESGAFQNLHDFVVTRYEASGGGVIRRQIGVFNGDTSTYEFLSFMRSQWNNYGLTCARVRAAKYYQFCDRCGMMLGSSGRCQCQARHLNPDSPAFDPLALGSLIGNWPIYSLVVGPICEEILKLVMYFKYGICGLMFLPLTEFIVYYRHGLLPRLGVFVAHILWTILATKSVSLAIIFHSLWNLYVSRKQVLCASAPWWLIVVAIVLSNTWYDYGNLCLAHLDRINAYIPWSRIVLCFVLPCFVMKSYGYVNSRDLVPIANRWKYGIGGAYYWLQFMYFQSRSVWQWLAYLCGFTRACISWFSYRRRVYIINKRARYILTCLAVPALLLLATNIWSGESAQYQGNKFATPVEPTMGENFWTSRTVHGVYSYQTDPGVDPQHFPRTILNNTFLLSCGERSMRVLGICRDLYVCTKHQFIDMLSYSQSHKNTVFSIDRVQFPINGGDFSQTGRAIKQSITTFAYEFKEGDNYVLDTESDTVLFRLRNCAQCCDIFKHFPLDYIDSGQIDDLWLFRKDYVSQEVDVFRSPTAKFQRNTYLSRSSLGLSCEWFSKETKYTTVNGDCGSVVLCARRGSCVVLGLHSALLSSGRSFSTYLTQKVLARLRSQLTTPETISDEEFRLPGITENACVLEHQAHERSVVARQDVERGESEIQFIASEGAVAQKDGRTKCFESPYWTWWRTQRDESGDLYVTKYVPPVLYAGWRWVPKVRFIRAVIGRKEVVDLQLLRFAETLLGLRLNLVSGIKNVGILTDFQALNGIAGSKFIKRINMNSAMGYPYRGSKKQNMIPLEDGNYALPEKFQNVLDIMEKRGEERIRPGCIFKAQLKDEPLSKKKIAIPSCLLDEKGVLLPSHKVSPLDCEVALRSDFMKIRVFQAINVEGLLLVRKYFLDLVSALQTDNLASGIAVGINCFSRQWDRLYEYMNPDGWGRNYICGDFSNFDQRMGSVWMTAAWRQLIKLILRSSKIAHLPEDERERLRNLLESIAHDVTFPVTNFFGEFVRLQGSNASGHPLTVIINGLVNYMYMAYVWGSIYPNNSFEENVRFMSYGDDNMLNVRPGFERFNQNSISEKLRSVGVIYTDASKSENFPDFVGELTFLKRTWEKSVYNGETFYKCPIERASIGKMLSMAKRSDVITEDRRFVSALVSAYYEHFQYAEESLQHFKELCNEFLEVHHLWEIFNSVLPNGWPDYGEFMRARMDCGVSLPEEEGDDDAI